MIGVMARRVKTTGVATAVMVLGMLLWQATQAPPDVVMTQLPSVLSR